MARFDKTDIAHLIGQLEEAISGSGELLERKRRLFDALGIDGASLEAILNGKHTDPAVRKRVLSEIQDWQWNLEQIQRTVEIRPETAAIPAQTDPVAVLHMA